MFMEAALEIRFERVWCMPNHLTFRITPITKLLVEEVTCGLWLDPFANENRIRQIIQSPDVNFITNDLNPDYPTDYHMDALEFLKMFPDESVDGVLYDPPYSPRQIAECYKNVGMPVSMKTTQSSFWSSHKNEIARIVKPGGKAICFGWNSQGCGKNRNFEMTRLLIVPHGGNHNDTLVTVEIKKNPHYPGVNHKN